MARHTFARGRRVGRAAVAAVAAVVSAATVAALGPPALAAPTDVPRETVVPATERTSDVSAVLYGAESPWSTDGAGARGVLHTLEGRSGRQWTRYSDGETVPVPDRDDLPAPQSTGDDVLAHRDGNRVTLRDVPEGTTHTVDIPGEQGFLGVFGTTVVTFGTVTAEDGTVVREVHLLTPEAGGTTEDTVVGGLPAGSQIGRPVVADEESIAFLVRVDGRQRIALVARGTGRVRGWTAPVPVDYQYAVLTSGHLVLYSTFENALLVVPRADPSAAPVEVELEGGSVNPAHHLTAVGDWLLYRRSHATAPVRAVPAEGGEAVTLFTDVRPKISAAPGHTAVVVGRTGTEDEDDWGVHRVVEGEDGRPTVVTVKPLPRPGVTIRGVSLAHGRLMVADDSRGRREVWQRTVAETGTPEFGERTLFTDSATRFAPCPEQDAECSRVHGLADGRIVWLDRGTDGRDTIRVDGPGTYEDFSYSVRTGGRITDVSGEYLVHTAPGEQTVHRIGHHAGPVLTRAPGAAAVWGDLLWSPSGTAGAVTAYDLRTGETVRTVDTGAGCVPEELQAVGGRLYVDCAGDGPSVVHDPAAKRTVTVPSGEALLGDGYVVTHDRSSGQLTLTSVAGGTASGRVLAELPDTGTSQRNVRWTVDEFGGHVAWVDDQERVHLVPSGVPTRPLAALGAPDNAPEVWAATADATPSRVTSVLLSKPADRWTLTVRDAVTGRTVDTVTGGSAKGRLSVGWRGLHPGLTSDVFLPDGAYDWTLSVTAADGFGAALSYDGTVVLRGANKVRHDHAGAKQPDGVADMITVSTGGWLTFQQGDGAGGFSGKTSALGWSNSVLVVSFGDLDGDRCNDVLVRTDGGELRGYRPECGDPVGPETPYTSLGTGWNAYDVLTSPGDITGDGRADLLGRRSATGDIQLFAGRSDGTLAAGRKIRSAWTSYTKIVGVGDLDGDGHGEVLAHRGDGALFRYDGTGTGLLEDRVLLVANWGLSYDTLVGVGDITGDGHADIVVRDRAGVLYRNNGKGNGTFTGRYEISAGWGGYKGLF
ncbi:FG-GAP-like repeat-containing protein [Streptomyces taklimakanensis]|uniref:FG-GAP-like repeat-containing protein n=1 Tax=Streptomyces taklimakanensis TaxID=2569853 RepID=UPI0030843669